MAALRAIGCNTIHNHTEQREPAFYEVADELGMLVWDADYCGGPLGVSMMPSHNAFPDVLSELKRQYPLWARTVANHPSVVLLMMECLFNPEAGRQLGEVYRRSDATRLLHSGFGITEPLDLACYACPIRMDKDDRLVDVRTAYKEWGSKMQTFKGRRVPLVNVEVYYISPLQNPSSPLVNESLARPTGEVIDFLGQRDVAGVNVFHQHAFQNEPNVATLGWPSRSGEGQHAASAETDGRPRKDFVNLDFVNLGDRDRPAFVILPTGQAIRAASRRYLGHDVPVPSARRPEVLVQVSRAGRGVSDAYVYAVPLTGAPGTPLGIRTDRNGIAWFQLRDPGRYAFSCRAGGANRTVELECPLQPVEVTTGGLGRLLQLQLSLDRHD